MIDDTIEWLVAAVFLLLVLAAAAWAEPKLTYDHDVLLSLIQTKEPDARLGYTRDRIEIRTRRSILVGWTDVLLTARFERRGEKVQLILLGLRAMGMEQRGKRFEEAAKGLLKLCNVKSTADVVEIKRNIEGQKEPNVYTFPVLDE
jgi:hypothetical protein